MEDLRKEGGLCVEKRYILQSLLLKGSDARKLREQCFSTKWLNINDDATYKRIMDYTNAELRDTENIRKI
jgi:HKD family nuclease